VLCNVANLLQGFVQGIVAFAMIFAVTGPMAVPVCMTLPVRIAVSGRFSSKSRHRHQSRCEHRRCDLIEFHFNSPFQCLKTSPTHREETMR
jgi:hypothetical protein